MKNNSHFDTVTGSVTDLVDVEREDDILQGVLLHSYVLSVYTANCFDSAE